MTMLNRRSLLAALSSVALTACTPNAINNIGYDIADGLDKDGIAAIAKSYRLAIGDMSGTALEALLTPTGEIDMSALKAAVADDFTAGRMFVHAGWRLSHTEGQLFILLSRLS